MEGWVTSCVGTGDSSTKGTDGKGDRALAGVEVENAEAGGEDGCIIRRFSTGTDKCNSDAL